MNSNMGFGTPLYMTKGIIHVKGSAKSHVGIHLSGGIIIIDGDVRDRIGGEMVKGAIVVKGKVVDVLPTFKFEGIVEDPIIKIRKKDEGVKVEGKYYKYSGDYCLNKPKGQLYISVESNPDLRK